MGGGQEPPDEKEELIRQLKRNGNTYFAPHGYAEPGEIICVEFPVEELADFILNLRKSESVNFEDSAPPLDTEELEKQMAAIRIPGVYIVGQGQSYWSLPENTIKQLLALFTQHTQIAVDKSAELQGDLKQVNTLELYIRIKRYITEFMGSGLYVVLEDEGDRSVVPRSKFADDLAKAIVNRLEQLEQHKKEQKTNAK